HREQGLEEPEPDVPCAICMSNISDAAHVDGCLHRFCFGCIRQWAARRAVCPLCRRPPRRSRTCSPASPPPSSNSGAGMSFNHQPGLLS
uniref:RING-type E3 ubiquitin transferase n=1 Tax=Amazona collaria TaxID=241587 RepID=A0A8B9G3Z3_9PSIT